MDIRHTPQPRPSLLGSRPGAATAQRTGDGVEGSHVAAAAAGEPRAAASVQADERAPGAGGADAHPQARHDMRVEAERAVMRPRLASPTAADEARAEWDEPADMRAWPGRGRLEAADAGPRQDAGSMATGPLGPGRLEDSDAPHAPAARAVQPVADAAAAAEPVGAAGLAWGADLDVPPDAVAPDVARLDHWVENLPPLRAEGIEHVDELPAGLRVLADVDTDELQVHVVDEPGEAIGSHGVATCYVLAARGLDEQGRTVLALGHYSSLTAPAAAVRDVEEALGDKGVGDFDLYVVGGQVSLHIDPEDPDRIDGGSLDTGMAFMLAAGARLAAARIGLSESEAFEAYEGASGLVVAETTGRPESVSVVISAEGVFHAAYDGGDHILFEVEEDAAVADVDVVPDAEAEAADGADAAEEAADAGGAIRHAATLDEWLPAEAAAATPLQHHGVDEPGSPGDGAGSGRADPHGDAAR